MNESTFETCLANSLAKIFPTTLRTQIETQTNFTLKLGHAVLKMDGAGSYAKGRADVILRVGNKATILLELKRPQLKLTDEDVSQAISYACVHSPMIPIVVVTNGSEVRIHSSFDGSQIHGENLDEKRLLTILQTTAKHAKQSREEAIRNLIEGSPLAWAAALRLRTKQSLSELVGSVEDLTRPLCSDFRFPRRATPVLAGGFAVGERALALLGPPLSGKTNVLAELCDRSEEFEITPLYIDCTDAEDILEEIALALSDTFGAAIPRDKIFDWLRIGAGDVRDGRPRLVLILDSLIPEQSDKLRKQAVGLLKNVGSNVAVLFALTETGFERLRNIPGRLTASKLGRDIKIVYLEELDEDEIDTAAQNLFQQTRIHLPPGARFELPMHQPRMIRLMLAMDQSLRDIPEGHYARLPSIVSSDVLVKLWETTSTNTELRSDLLALAHAYVNDLEQRENSAELSLTSIGIGTMTLGTVEKTLSESSFERLLQQGHIKRLSLKEQVLIVPTVPEMLSAALISVLKSIIINTSRSEGHEAANKQLLRYTRDLALGDRVAAILLQRLITEDAQLFWACFRALMEDEPKRETMKDGDYLMQLPNGQFAEMKYKGNSLIITLPDGQETVIPLDDEEESTTMTGNLHSWNILSHLAYEPIAAGGQNEMRLLGVTIMNKLGRFRATLKNFGPARIGNPALIYEHDLPGFGSVPCPGRGIVEPIVYAMQLNIQRFGEVMDAFVGEAIKGGDPALLMRLYVAASSLKEIADPEIRERSTKMERRLSAALDGVLNVIHGSDRK